MTETGTVREIKDKLITIAPDRSASCFGCMNMECKTGGGFITAENTEGLPIKTGQTVEVKAKRASLLRQALTAFLPPLVGFIAGYALVRFFFPQAGEGAAPGMGVIFLFAGAFFVYWKRKGKNGEMTFEVTKILGNK